MKRKYNIKITENKKDWLVFVSPIDYDTCRDTFMKFFMKYDKVEII